MHFKRFSILLICLILIISPIIGDIYCYADDYDQWYQVTTNEQAAEAFRYYCKSRDLTIEGSALDAVTSFTSGAYKSLCKTVGLDMDAIQANIKYSLDQSGNINKFLFNASGVNAMNRLFSQFLQDNDLEVGDTVEDKTLYDGQMFGDSLLFITNRGSYQTNLSGDYSPSMVLQKGSAFLYDTPIITTWFDMTNAAGQTIYKNITLPDGVLNQMYVKAQVGAVNSTEFNISSGNTSGMRGFYYRYNYDLYAANVLVYDTYNNAYYFGILTTYPNYTNYYFQQLHKITSGTDQVQKNVNVYITTNNSTINNNTYEGNTYTTINNEGDTNNYYGDDEPDPDDPTPDDPTPDNPSGGTPPPWDIGGGEGEASDGNGNTWNITFPDFELPDLNIDWSISGLGDKFPFSIPFDMVALITALNAEPEAPEFAGTVDFGFTSWDYDIDLSEFDSVAAACRIAELLLLVFGLILITRQIIKG